jgi:hypothetical protein
MENKIAMFVYKWLVKYCKKHKHVRDGNFIHTCKRCIFDDVRPLCGCILNIPTKWFKLKNM